jgi:hypothetical protein
MVSVEPDTVQTAVVVEAKETGSPEDAAALMVNGGDPIATLLSAANVIVFAVETAQLDAQATETATPATTTVPDRAEPPGFVLTENTAWPLPAEFIPAVGVIQATVLSAVQPACALEAPIPNTKLPPALTCEGALVKANVLAGIQAPPGAAGKLRLGGGLVTKRPG